MSNTHRYKYPAKIKTYLHYSFKDNYNSINITHSFSNGKLKDRFNCTKNTAK